MILKKEYKLSEETRKKMSYSHKGKIGRCSSNWKGGKTIPKDGYIRIRIPDHPDNQGGYVLEHRYVVEKHIGRYLKKEEVIHHINEIKTDNRIENLMIFPNNKEHIKFHRKIEQFGITNPIKKQIEERWKNYIL